MNEFIKITPWKIVEDRFLPERVKSSESLFSIGNGIMGQRANFEEAYGGKTFQGSYIGGVYYPDKTRVGWWKNGYPEYFAKVINSAFWIGIDVSVDGEQLDISQCAVDTFYRELDMQHGVLTRHMTVTMRNGVKVEVESVRFLSLVRTELGAIRYSVKPLNRDAKIEFNSYINADVRNEDSNYDEKFWEYVASDADGITMRTLKTGFEVCWSMINRLEGASFENVSEGERIAHKASVSRKAGEAAVIYKYTGIASSLNHKPEELAKAAAKVAGEAAAAGFDMLLGEQRSAWLDKWSHCDISIEGDDEAQQGIRYCIFMLLQTYTGADARLNIGPKGFTGEKYGGVTYWDTEAYCIPFYLSSAGQDVARSLLIYRYNQLDKAIENAAKLGFKDGAALYPMVTMNGEECHNEWEITFEEIHRNGAIANAIRNYIRYAGEREYLAKYGLEVLIGIARFWSQRITFSEERGKYVMLGVTGPNEYENNVNNNWYTNYISLWCMRYAIESAEWVRDNYPADWKRICAKRSFDLDAESVRWKDIIANMHLPEDKKQGVFLQQDGYMDKEQILVKDLDPAQRPINQKWSWDRILRSCFIKQADVLQGIYFFMEDFDMETIRRNFHFYEQRTVHESSLSPCVHSILATVIGDMDKAYEMYLRTSRLDLDDYNREIEEGCHITSMAGSWLSVVEGFGGMRVDDGMLSFKPSIPESWNALSFNIDFRGRIVKVRMSHRNITLSASGIGTIDVIVNGSKVAVGGEPIDISL